MKYVFIVGCPRSGSTWTTFLLAQHPSVATFQHAKVFDYLIRMEQWHRLKAGFSFIVKPDATNREDKLRLAEVLPREDLYPLLRPAAEGILRSVATARPGASVVIDKTPENGHLADFILKVLPEAWFLHIVRDPRSVYCSHRSASSSWARWEFPTQPIDGARFWKKDVLASRAIAAKTERFLEVRYEDLKAHGARELCRILEWLELDVAPDFPEQALGASTKDKVRDTLQMPDGFVRKAPAAGWRDELSPRDARIIEHLAGDLMDELGYERSQEPYRRTPLRVWLRDTTEPVLAFLEAKLHRITQLAHWRWVGRKLDWPDP